MTEKRSGLTRRTALKGLGGAAATVGVGGAAFVAMTGGASADAHVDLSYGEASISTNDGTVEYVAIYGDSGVEWSGFEKPATHAQIVIDGTLLGPDDEEQWTGTMHDTGQFELTPDWGALGEEITLADDGRKGTIVSDVGYGDDGDGNNVQDESRYWDVVAPNGNASEGSNEYNLPNQNAVPASYLEVDGDGEGPVEYTIEMESTYYWFANDGSEIYDEPVVSDLTVDVTNLEESSTATDGDQDDGVTAG